MNRLADRFGRTGAAAIASVIWALPMAAWAGSFDLSPMDKTAYPWIALCVGIVMLAVWLILVARLARTRPASDSATHRPHRLDFARMSKSERRWALALVAFGLGALAWLNAAATVDWTPLATAIKAGHPRPILFGLVLACFLVAMLAGAWFSWRRESAAFAERAAASAADRQP